MPKSAARAAFAASILLSISCASRMRPEPLAGQVLSLTPTAKDLTVAELPQCTRLGRATGVSTGGLGTTHDMREIWAKRDLKNSAETRGATHVEIVSEDDSEQDGMTLAGVAYRCP